MSHREPPELGLSRQIVPTVLEKLLRDKDRAKRDRVMKALRMKKLDIKGLKAAHAGQRSTG